VTLCAPIVIKRHAQKLVTGTILFFVVFGILSLIDWNNNDSENTHQNILPAPISIASAKLAPVIEWQKCLERVLKFNLISQLG